MLTPSGSVVHNSQLKFGSLVEFTFVSSFYLNLTLMISLHYVVSVCTRRRVLI